MGDSEQKNLVNELRMGRELARQLQVHLNVPSSSKETRELLVQKILSSYEKALCMLNLSSLVIRDPHPAGVSTAGMPESPPRSLSGSPHSDQDSDRDLKNQDTKDASGKRKGTATCTKQVRVNPGMALEGPLDDGFSWRKYGQKDILGAKYPRGYYRCTHRIVQGCLATKQVQRSDEDPTIFEITYRGRHTCTQMLNYSQLPDNQETNSSNIIEPQQQENQQYLSQDRLMNQLLSGLKVITEGLDHHHEQSTPPFCFPCTSNIKAETQVFSPSMLDSNLMGNFSPSFISPSSTPGNSNYFSASSSGMHQSFGENRSLHTSDSELSDIIAAASTSATNTPTVGIDFPFHNVEFDPKHFSFDTHGFLS